MYNVQCLNGHVFTAAEGSDLEKRCIEHEGGGFIDALILHPSECPECQYELEPSGGFCLEDIVEITPMSREEEKRIIGRAMNHEFQFPRYFR
jgi:hypothetical protein